jgi:hypothetical protein
MFSFVSGSRSYLFNLLIPVFSSWFLFRDITKSINLSEIKLSFEIFHSSFYSSTTFIEGVYLFYNELKEPLDNKVSYFLMISGGLR